MSSPRTRQRQSAQPGADAVPATVRVEVVCQYVVERYDASGRVLDAQQAQPVKVAALSPEALGEALAGLAQQLAQAWQAAPVAAPETQSGDEG